MRLCRGLVHEQPPKTRLYDFGIRARSQQQIELFTCGQAHGFDDELDQGTVVNTADVRIRSHPSVDIRGIMDHNCYMAGGVNLHRSIQLVKPCCALSVVRLMDIQRVVSKTER